MQTAPILRANQRFDREDWVVLLNAIATDSKLHAQQFWAPTQYILKGFEVSGLNTQTATVTVADSVLINTNNSGCFSWFVGVAGASALVTGGAGPDGVAIAGLTANTSNYLELELLNVDGTPLPRAFWDKTANAGSGGEFQATVNTVQDIAVTLKVLTGGWSGSTDRIKLVKIDTDVSGDIKSIFDERDLFFRLGTPTNPLADFPWVTQAEPEITLTLTGVVGNFVVGEIITIGGVETASVSTGGTSTIKVILPSAKTFTTGDAVVGPSGSGTLDTTSESFSGADKDIGNLREIINALQTEIKAIKGTSFWYEPISATIAGTLRNAFLTTVSGLTASANFAWTGAVLNITDNSGTPAGSDPLGAIRIFDDLANLQITRQDAASTPITIPDGNILWVELPSPLANRTYSGVGVGGTNYRVSPRGSVPLSESTYWIAYREATKLIIRGRVELEAGEAVEISDTISTPLLASLGLDEVNPPSYSSDIRGVTNESLTARIGSLTDSVGDEQEDRSAYFRSANTIKWDTSPATPEIQWTAPIILDILNVKAGGAKTTHQINIAASPVALTNGQIAYVSINRAINEVGLAVSVASTLPAQTQANKDVIVLATRIDSGGIPYLHIPLHKQLLAPNEVAYLGASQALPLIRGAYAAVVGTTAEVADGRATHPTAQAAHDDTANVPTGSRILLLRHSSGYGNLNISRNLTFEGLGWESRIGNLTISGSFGCKIINILILGNIINNGPFTVIDQCWQSVTGNPTITDNDANETSIINIIREV